MLPLLLLALLAIAEHTSARPAHPLHITVLGDSPSLRLAGQDAARYLRLLLCGHGPATSACIAQSPTLPAPGLPSVLIATVGALSAAQLAALPAGHLSQLTGDAHLVAPVGGGVTLCTGATPRAALYAVYTLLEALGARFYLTGDVLPQPNASLSLPAAPILSVPLFAERGLNPFHDFPMGPDWWTLEYFKLLGTQMAKMKMNKWGFHTYPAPSAGFEPLAWVGTAAQYDAATGAVLPADGGAYTSSWYLTQDFPRGNVPGSVSRATSDYCCGASLPFPRDCYGSQAQAQQCWPATAQDSAAVLNGAAELLQGAFAWGARTGGISACLGSEMPLVPPPGSTASTAELYAGMFGRAAAAIPAADCWWLWTTEAVEDHGNGKGYPQNNPLWEQLRLEIGTALAARDAAAPALAVGANGWCLGPGDNSSYFDKVVADPRFSLAAIDGCLGWCDVDPAFAEVKAHPATVVAWMEDDLGLAGAELWVQRTLDHAADAARYNASGLLGLLWRTFETAPQVAALAAAGWNTTTTTAATTSSPSAPPTASALSLYTDFCTASFGAATAQVCASLFLSLDGAAPGAPTFEPQRSLLPRGCQACCGGPVQPLGGQEGAVAVLNTSAWEAWGGAVAGAGASARAAQWVGLMLYHAALSEACLAAQRLAVAAGQVVDEASAREVGFPALAALTWAWTDMMTALLGYASTPGELGMVAAHEGGNWPSYFLSTAGPILTYASACAQVDSPQSACFWDNYTSPSGRVLPHTVSLNSASNTREGCAGACAAAGYPLAGVEFGVACFCGAALPPASASLPASACAAMPCAGAPREGCGAADIISVYPSHCPAAPGVPPGLLPSSGYAGAAPRLWLSAPRSTVGAEEGGVAVEAVVLAGPGGGAVAVSAVWWVVPGSGSGGNSSTPLVYEGGGRGIWSALLPLPTDPQAVLEYVVVAQWPGGGSTAVPVEGAQSVVVVA